MYDRIVAAAMDSVWVVTETKLRDIWTFLDRAAAGVRIDAATLEVLTAASRERRNVVTRSAVGILPVVGTISHRASMLGEASGGISTEALAAGFDQLQALDEVGTIILDVDSPGGTYQGIPELASKIHAARGGKPIVAAVNAAAGSGALWIASAADEVVITPSGSAGSVGAYVVHDDESGLNEQVGVKRTYISYGEYKVEGNPDQPLTDDALAYARERVAAVGQEFEAALGKFRGRSTKQVHETFGRGRMLDARQALQVGMVDRIATFDEVVQQYATGKKPRKSTRVENFRRYLQINS